MRLVCPYNEILPKKAAHDVYLFHQCEALGSLSVDVHLLCGKGSLPDQEIHKHYATSSSFKIHRLPIVRKNIIPFLSWNFPFFLATQQFLKRTKPDVVLLSVLKQARFHFKHKIPGVRYVYEAHQLLYYPPYPFASSASAVDKQSIEEEKLILSQADLIVVPTAALRSIILNPPYSLNNPIQVIPLAVKAEALPLKKKNETDQVTVFYVGQLYRGQGITLLLEALALEPSIHLKIIGGKKEEIIAYENLAAKWGIKDRVTFLAFQKPAHLPNLVAEADAFVAPFKASERMPYVAHTKLYEYAMWKRPFIAPALPSAEEHFSEENGVLFFEPGNKHSLAAVFKKISQRSFLSNLQQKALSINTSYSWNRRAQTYLAALDPG